MSRQRTFFDAECAADLAAKSGAAPCDPNIDVRDVARVTGQNAAILERLRLGPALTDQLAKISRKYTSRISDLRAVGHVIECQRGQGGNNLYVLRDNR